MMIEDEELRELFEAESSQHLEVLERGLLKLEREPGNSELIEEVFRAIHSLKGAARMLGVTSVEALAHHLEDVLDQARRGKVVLTPARADSLYKALDGLSQLVDEAVTGTPCKLDLRVLLANLENSAQEEAALAPIKEEPAPQREPAPPAAELEVAPEPTEKPAAIIEKTPAEAGASAFRIATVRVETSKLDVILTKTGDLMVTSARAQVRLQELAELRAYWQDWMDQPGKKGPETQRLQRLGALLDTLHTGMLDDQTRLENITRNLVEDVEDIRLLPLSTLFEIFPRFVRDLARQQGKQVHLIVEGDQIRADKRILEEFKDPMMHLLRNAIDHGIEEPVARFGRGKNSEAVLRISVKKTAASLEIEVSDDGRGLDLDAIRNKAIQNGLHSAEELSKMSVAEVQTLIFNSGFSTRNVITEISGRGVGLDVVRSQINKLNGSLWVQSEPGAGTTFHIRLPNSVATMRVLICQSQGRAYALPIEAVGNICNIEVRDIFQIEGRQTVRVPAMGDVALNVAWLSALLNLRETEKKEETSTSVSCIVLSQNEEKLALLVPHVIDVQEVVVKSLGPLWADNARVLGAAVLPTGQVCLVLSPTDLFRASRKSVTQSLPSGSWRKKYSLLLAEDSLTMRTQEKRILEGAGYEVVAAVDGLDAWEKLNQGVFDAVISDVQMPNMDGLSLTRKIRAQSTTRSLPIILLTSLASDEDRLQGIQAGANAYLTKPTFNPKDFLETVARLL